MPRIKVSEQGNIIEVTKLDACGHGHGLKKLDADHYLDLVTGEIYNYDRAKDRSESVKSLRRTFRKIRALINSNCAEPEKVRWITLTYAENMQDVKRLYRDFERFWKRFKYRYPGAEYIVVAEPQKRGAWHLHGVIVWFRLEKAPYIPNAELRELWGQGYVNVRAVTNVDNLGAYLSAYLADVEVLPGEDSQAATVCKTLPDGTQKRFVKGGRLHLYPPGMNLYRCSRGVKRPIEWWVETAEDMARYEALRQNVVQTWAGSCDVATDGGLRTLHVEKEYYNLARKREGLDTKP